jgi:hypothetical protein
MAATVRYTGFKVVCTYFKGATATVMHMRYTVAMDTCCKVGFMACVLMLPAQGAKLG